VTYFTFAAIAEKPAVFPQCKRSLLAHRVISLPHGNPVALGLKRTLGRILRVDGLVAAAPTPSGSRRGHVQRLRSFSEVTAGPASGENCLHHAPLAPVPLMIRWGAETSSDRLRQCARCTKCGHKGATLQHPGWAGTHIGFPIPLTRIGFLRRSRAKIRSAMSPRLGRLGSDNRWIPKFMMRGVRHARDRLGAIELGTPS
jgi:hypothetical protein